MLYEKILLFCEFEQNFSPKLPFCVALRNFNTPEKSQIWPIDRCQNLKGIIHKFDKKIQSLLLEYKNILWSRASQGLVKGG